jgi:hypothetical protein
MSISLNDNQRPKYKEQVTSSSTNNSSRDNAFSSIPAASRNISDKEEITFSGKSENYCVSFIDMVNSSIW